MDENLETEINTPTGAGCSAATCSATKDVIAFGQPLTIGCDEKCHKAWGINNRPKEQLSDDDDDYFFLADDDLGDAPEDPGTYEGGHAKPTRTEDRLNKWCFRECERSCSAKRGESLTPPDFSKRLFNIPQNSQDQERL